MKNNQGFTLIELLAVIVVLAIVTVIATQSILPYMSSARSDAFRIEASHVINASEDAVTFLNMGTIDLKNNTASCKSGNVVCFTISELINLGLYDGEANTYKGKVLIDVSNTAKPTYTLYLQKGAEFNITGGTDKDYVNNGTINDGGWTDTDFETYTTCSCS